LFEETFKFLLVMADQVVLRLRFDDENAFEKQGKWYLHVCGRFGKQTSVQKPIYK